MPGLALALALFVWALTAPAGASPAPAPQALPLAPPPGWSVTSAHSLAAGADHYQLHRAHGPVNAQLVRAGGEGLRLRAVVSHDRVSGPGVSGERTSSVCARTACLAAVNADFARLGTDEPVGAVVSEGRLLRSPVSTHHQFAVGWAPIMATGLLETRLRIVTADLESIDIAGVNTTAPGGPVLHTAAWGPAVQAGTGEVIMRIGFPSGPAELLAGETRVIELGEVRPSGSSASPNGSTAWLRASGEAAAALGDLAARISRAEIPGRALLRLDSSMVARESVGGTPVLVRDGRVWAGHDGTNFNDGLHPRTAIGWDTEGRVLLLTVDGRQPGFSMGMDLPSLAQLLVDLGAVEALNLDGGGSTTMVVRGSVVNRPSDRLVRRATRETVVRAPAPDDPVVGHVERPVSTALVLVVEGAVVAPARAGDPFGGEGLVLPPPRQLALSLPSGDPASLEAGDAPLLIALPAGATAPLSEPQGAGWALTVAVVLLAAVGAAAARCLPPHLAPFLTRRS